MEDLVTPTRKLAGYTTPCSMDNVCKTTKEAITEDYLTVGNMKAIRSVKINDEQQVFCPLKNLLISSAIARK